MTLLSRHSQFCLIFFLQRDRNCDQDCDTNDSNLLPNCTMKYHFNIQKHYRGFDARLCPLKYYHKSWNKKHSENADPSTSVTFDLKLWPWP